MNTEALPDLGCACANLRRAARLVTRLYGQEMGGVIEPAQYALLTALKQKPGCSQALLGHLLGLDKTSLSRNLRVMKDNGWIEPVAADDRRERGYSLSATGLEVLAVTRPGWKRAQSSLRKAMGADDWEAMNRIVSVLSEAAQFTASGGLAPALPSRKRSNQ